MFESVFKNLIDAAFERVDKYTNSNFEEYL